MKVFKIVIYSILCFLVIAYMAVAGWIYGINQPEAKYKSINIQISKESEHEGDFVSQKDIMSLVQSSGIKIKGKKFSEVNTLKLREYIEKGNRLINHVACYHTPDSSLRIDVTQRTPVMRIKSITLGDNYLDREGVLMPAPKTTFAMHLPLVTGHVRQSHIEGLLEMVDFLDHNSYWRDMITQINIRQDGEVEVIPECANHIILLGDFTNLEEKLDHIETFYDKVMPRKGWNTYRYISAKYNNEIIGIK